jgi:hypothetical protein
VIDGIFLMMAKHTKTKNKENSKRIDQRKKTAGMAGDK